MKVQSELKVISKPVTKTLFIDNIINLDILSRISSNGKSSDIQTECRDGFYYNKSRQHLPITLLLYFTSYYSLPSVSSSVIHVYIGKCVRVIFSSLT